MTPQLEKKLLENMLVTMSQLDAASKYASSSGMSLEKALVVTGVLKIADLGRCLSSVNRLPYMNIAGQGVTRETIGALSPACMKRWKAMPVEFDPAGARITVAVPSEDDAARLRHIFSFLMAFAEVKFVVALEFEIEDALGELLDGRKIVTTVAPAAAAPSVQKNRFVMTSLHKRMEEIKQGKAPMRGGKQGPDRPKEDLPVELLTSLVSAVSMLTAAHMAAKPSELELVRNRARYCQLLASRLNLLQTQATKVVLGAWLSGIEDRRDLIGQFICPYNIEAIVFPKQLDSKQDIETLILSLVRSYETFAKELPGQTGDAGAVRRWFSEKWGPAVDRQDIIEVFLQILMDEQFLDKLGKIGGTVLVIDHSGAVSALVETAFKRAGRDVRIASGLEQARQIVADLVPTMIIASADSWAKDLLSFCRQLKSGDENSRNIPVIVVVSARSEVKGTEFLRAGVDDFLTDPLDLELLNLKVEKLLISSSRQTRRKGVSGSLSDMSFSDLIQVLSAGCKSVEIVVKRDDQEGRIVLREGNVIHAESAGISGENAFYQLMQWRSGEFSMNDCSVFPEPTVLSSTMSLLMEGARLVDEKTTE